MLSACNFAIISKSQKMELEGSSQDHAVWPGARSSLSYPHKAEVPCTAAFTPSSSCKSTACPKNPHQSIPTFNLNLFCYRLSLSFLSSFLSGHKTSLFISSLFKYLSYNIMSSPSVLPAQGSTSLVLAIFLQKSHFLDLSSFFAELYPDLSWNLDRKSWTVHCSWGFASPRQSRRDMHLRVTDKHVYGIWHLWFTYFRALSAFYRSCLAYWTICGAFLGQSPQSVAHFSTFLQQALSSLPALPTCPREVPGFAFFHIKLHPFYFRYSLTLSRSFWALVLSTKGLTTPLALLPCRHCCLKSFWVQRKFVLVCCYCCFLINQQRENPTKHLLAFQTPRMLNVDIPMTRVDFLKTYPAPPGFGFLWWKHWKKWFYL